MSLEYQIGQVVYSKSGHDQGDVQIYVEKDVAAKLQTGDYLLDADIKKALKKYQQVRDV